MASGTWSRCDGCRWVLWDLSAQPWASCLDLDRGPERSAWRPVPGGTGLAAIRDANKASRPECPAAQPRRFEGWPWGDEPVGLDSAISIDIGINGYDRIMIESSHVESTTSKTPARAGWTRAAKCEVCLPKLAFALTASVRVPRFSPRGLADGVRFVRFNMARPSLPPRERRVGNTRGEWPTGWDDSIGDPPSRPKASEQGGENFRGRSFRGTEVERRIRRPEHTSRTNPTSIRVDPMKVDPRGSPV